MTARPDQPGKEDRDQILGPDEDQGAGHRGACSRGRANRRETHLGGRGACLAGYRVGRVLSGPFGPVLLVMRL
jgi:hypothetical protein